MQAKQMTTALGEGKEQLECRSFLLRYPLNPVERQLLPPSHPSQDARLKNLNDDRRERFAHDREIEQR